MARLHPLLLLAPLVVTLVLGSSCGSDDDPNQGGSADDDAGGSGAGGAQAGGSAAGGDSNCFDYAGFDGSIPVTAFRADVLPIFQRSCGLSTACHADPTSPVAGNEARPYLGPPLTNTATDMEIAAILSANV